MKKRSSMERKRKLKKEGKWYIPSQNDIIQLTRFAEKKGFHREDLLDAIAYAEEGFYDSLSQLGLDITIPDDETFRIELSDTSSYYYPRDKTVMETVINFAKDFLNNKLLN